MSRFDDPKSKTYQTPTFFLMSRGVRGAKAGLTRGQWALQLDKIVCGQSAIIATAVQQQGNVAE